MRITFMGTPDFAVAALVLLLFAAAAGAYVGLVQLADMERDMAGWLGPLAVGLVVARPPETLGADPFFPAFIAGIEATLAPLGQALVLQVVPDRDREVEGYRRLAADGRVDGVFLTDLRVGDPRPALLERLGLPATGWRTTR